MEFREIVTPVESVPPKVCLSVSCWSCSAGWVYSIVKGREEPGLALLPVRRLLPRRSDDDGDAVLKKKEKISLGMTCPAHACGHLTSGPHSVS